MAILAVIASTLVVMGYLAVIWWMDRYEREPFWVLAMAFLWGGLGGTTLAIVLSAFPQLGLQAFFGEETGSALTAVFVAPTVEELTKALIFVVIGALGAIDSETDGLIYGAATGLGFAAVENVLYYVAAADTLYQTIVMRTLFTSIVHCVSSSLIGIAIGWAIHRGFRAIWALPVGYIAAVAMHGSWNLGAVVTEQTGQGLVLVASAGLLTAAGITMFGLTQWMLHREHKVMARFLSHEVSRGTLPAEHAAWIPFWTKRRRVRVGQRDRYIRLATLLAFRQHQAELKGKPSDSPEITKLREQVRGLAYG